MCAVIGVAVLLRLVGLDAFGLWNDEIMSVMVARRPLGEVLARLMADVHPPLYFLVLSAWGKLTGFGDGMVRLPSAVFGISAIGAFVWLVRAILPIRVGRVATILFALSSLQIYYSHEARPYSLLVLWTVLSMALFVRLVQRPGRRLAAGLVLVTAAGLYSHYFFGLVPLVQASIVCLALAIGQLPQARQQTMHVALSLAVGGLLFAPWLPSLFRQLGSVGDQFWVPEPDLVWLVKIPWMFLGATRPAWAEPATLWHHGATALVALVILLVAGRRLGIIRGGDDPDTTDSSSVWDKRLVLILAVTWLALPMLVAFVWSIFRTPVLTPRNLLVVSPALPILLALAWAAVPPRASAVLLAAAIGLGLGNQVHFSTNGHYPSLREPAAYVAVQRRDRDGFVFDPPRQRSEFSYYEKVPISRIEKFDAPVSRFGRIWQVVYKAGEWNDSVARNLSLQGFRLVEHREFDQVVVILWARGGGGLR